MEGKPCFSQFGEIEESVLEASKGASSAYRSLEQVPRPVVSDSRDEVLEISVTLARVNGLDPDQTSRLGIVLFLR
jgi:hypothetical protein